MASLLESKLENARNRYTTLLKTKRNDMIARIVLERIEEEIQTLERGIKHEEEPRQEVATRSSPCGITRRFRQAMYRYWVKCYSYNHAIPSIPASETL